MHDALVIGGGPGGLYAATLLARHGFDVLAIEEHAVTGEPVHCTGILAAEAFDEFDLPREAILNPLSTARFFSPSRQSVEHSTPSTEAVVIDRARFDRGLQVRAEHAGVKVRLGLRVTSLEMTSAGAIARTSQGEEIHARVAVLACGANYTLQKQLGLGLPAAFLTSAQLELPARAAGDVEVHFGAQVAPKGFAWVVPVNRNGERRARVGLMCDHDAAGFFERFAATVAPRWGLDLSGLSRGDSGASRPRQKMLPLAPLPRTYGDRLLAVGDAAGLVKATTGGGIYYSLVSSQLAAAVLTDALRRDTLSAAVLKSYEEQWRARLGGELRAQLALRTIAERLGDTEIEALFDLARTNGIMPIIRRAARFNHHRQLIVSLFQHSPARRVLLKHLVVRTASLSGT